MLFNSLQEESVLDKMLFKKKTCLWETMTLLFVTCRWNLFQIQFEPLCWEQDEFSVRQIIRLLFQCGSHCVISDSIMKTALSKKV